MELTESKTLLPEVDRDYLDSKAFAYDVARSGGELHVILHEFDLPEHYDPRVVDLLIVLPAGYPNSNPDMFWTRPTVKRLNGALPLNSDYMQPFPDGTWQRWSRHFPGNWRPGVDGLRTYIASIRRELQKGV